jgi:hypothetical protein
VWFDKSANEGMDLRYVITICEDISSFSFLSTKFCILYIVMIDVDQDTEWIKLNVDQVGYYRVNYNTHGWRIFQDLLRTQHVCTNYYVSYLI